MENTVETEVLVTSAQIFCDFPYARINDEPKQEET